MTTRRALTLLILAAALLPLGGCSRRNPALFAAQARIDELERNNRDLADKLARAEAEVERLRSALRMAQGRFQEADSLRAQLASAQAEVQRLRDEMNRAPAGRNRGADRLGEIDNIDVTVGADGTIYAKIPGEILFSSGKAELRKESLKTLAQAASVLQSEFSGREVVVEGHTDDDPIKKSGWKSNWHLSAARACAVVEYLVARGIDSDRVCAAGFSQFRPVAPNSSRDGKARNRRVEIAILPPGVEMTPGR